MMQDIFFPLSAQTAFQKGIDAAGTGAGVRDIGVGAFVGIIVQAILQIIGVVFLILIIYGGLKWMSASGQQKQLEEAQKIIIHSVIGLIIVIVAYGISVFVMQQLLKAV